MRLTISRISSGASRAIFTRPSQFIKTLILNPESAARLASLTLLTLYIVLVALSYDSASGPGNLGLRCRVLDGVLRVSWVMPAGQAWHDGTRPGMEVLAVDGKDAGELLDTTSSFVAVNNADLLDDHGERIHARIMYGPLTRGPIRFSLWTLGAAFALLATVVGLRRPDLRTAWLFFLFSAFTALALAVSPSAGGTQPTWSLVTEFLSMVGVGATLVPFILSLVRDQNTPLPRRFVSVQIAVGVVLVGSYAVAVLVNPIVYDILRVLLGLYLATSMLSALAILAIEGVRSRSTPRGRHARLVLLGILLGTTPFVTLTLLPEALGRTMLVPAHFAIMPSVLIPATMTFAIVRLQLLGIRRLIHRGMVYAATATVLMVVVIGLTVAVSPLIQKDVSPERSAFLVGVLVTLGVLVFHPVRSAIRWLIDRYIYKDVADPHRLIGGIRDDLSSANHPEDAATLIDRAASALHAEAAVLFRGPSPRRSRVVATAGERAQEVLDRIYPGLFESIDHRERKAPLELRWGAETLLVAPMWVAGTYVGHLLLGPRRGGEVFAQDEKRLLDTLTPILALYLHQSDLSGQLVEVNQRLVVAEEAERARLASDLHDGPLQKAILLGGVVDPALTDPQELARELISELREVCSRLRPAILDDLGLVPALEWLLEDASRRFGICPHLALDGVEDADRFPLDTELALFRITQEAISNAVRHGRAKAIDVSLTAEDRALSLRIEDNGIGYSPGAGAESGLGLPGIRGRVNQLDGSLDIRSTPGTGTSISVRVPLGSQVDDEG